MGARGLQSCRSGHPALPDPWPPYLRERCQPPGFWAAAHTHARTRVQKHTQPPPPPTHVLPPHHYTPPQPSEDPLSAGLSPSAPAWYPRRIGGRGSGWVEIQRAVIYSERHGENKNRGLSLLLFVVPVCLSLSLCAAAAYACVCPSSVSACRDDYHRCIIPPNDRRLTPTSPIQSPCMLCPVAPRSHRPGISQGVVMPFWSALISRFRPCHPGDPWTHHREGKKRRGFGGCWMGDCRTQGGGGYFQNVSNLNKSVSSLREESRSNEEWDLLRCTEILCRIRIFRFKDCYTINIIIHWYLSLPETQMWQMCWSSLCCKTFCNLKGLDGWVFIYRQKLMEYTLD